MEISEEFSNEEHTEETNEDGTPKKNTDDLPNFYKTTSKITSYGLTHSNPITGNLKEGLSID